MYKDTNPHPYFYIPPPLPHIRHGIAQRQIQIYKLEIKKYNSKVYEKDIILI